MARSGWLPRWKALVAWRAVPVKVRQGLGLSMCGLGPFYGALGLEVLEIRAKKAKDPRLAKEYAARRRALWALIALASEAAPIPQKARAL